MISRRFSLWQKLVALAPLLLLGVNLPGEMMLRCRVDGSLRPACCCPADEAPEPASPVVRAQDCCDREVTATVRPVADAVGSTEHDVARTLAVASLAAPLPLSMVPAARPAWGPQRRGPPGDGPPLVLLKHAFLI